MASQAVLHCGLSQLSLSEAICSAQAHRRAGLQESSFFQRASMPLESIARHGWGSSCPQSAMLREVHHDGCGPSSSLSGKWRKHVGISMATAAAPAPAPSPTEPEVEPEERVRAGKPATLHQSLV